MYTPLYIKTNNSLLESMIKIDELISYAKQNDIKSLSITDNTMYGVMDFYHECINNKIKPIIGIEVMYKNNKVLLYAKNYEGYLKLCKIISTEFKIEVDNNILVILPYESNHLYNELKEFYTVFQGFSSISERESLKGDNKVFINETLCLTKSDQEYLRYLDAIRNKKVLLAVDTEYENKYIYSEEEARIISGNYYENNEKITDMCNVTIKFNNDLLANYPVDDSYEYLKKVCIDGLKKKFGNTVDKKYQERLKYELGIINKMGYSNYFLVVWDYVKYAKENGILVGPGRGSSAGSLVAYLLDITEADPLKYDLLFERFLNPERVTMPDIDVDFEATRRYEVIEYCKEKYGEKKVVPIITFQTMASRQATRDVGKVMGISLSDIDKICKLIDSRKTLKENLDVVSKELYTKELQKMYKIAMKFEGIKKSVSIHASGVIISNTDLDNIIPLDSTELDSEFNTYLTGYDATYLEKIGLLKMDILFLRNLTLIDNILKDIPDLKFSDIPLDDTKAIDMFKHAYTLGIFQFEKDGMRDFLLKLKANNFTDIYNAIAFYRPGPMDSIDSYIKRRNGKEKIDYIVPALEPILKETLGIIVYQEQIMNIARVIASYSLGEADILRRAISKKKEDILVKEKDKFISKAIENGYTKEIATKIYDLIFKFASYGFNKSHSIVYALISYRMAYLKAHYPYILLKHLLNYVIGDKENTKNYIYECKRYGVDVSKPSINKSSLKYEVVGDKLYFPLSNINDITTSDINKIIEARVDGEFNDVYDFFSRCHISKKTLEKLILVGVFDELGETRKTLMENLDVLLNYGDVTSYLATEYALKPELKIMDEYPKKTLMTYEFDLLGLYLTDHPVTEYRNRSNMITLDRIPEYFDRYVNVVGIINRLKVTSGEKPVCFITLSDEITSIDVVMFNDVYENNKLLNKGNIVSINGRVQRRFDKYQIVVNSINVLE